MSPCSKTLHRIRRLNRMGRLARPLEAAALKSRKAEAWPGLSFEQAEEQWLGWLPRKDGLRFYFSEKHGTPSAGEIRVDCGGHWKRKNLRRSGRAVSPST